MAINFLPFELVNFFSGQDWDNYYYYKNMYNNIKKNLWNEQEAFALMEEVNRAKLQKLIDKNQYMTLLRLIDSNTSESAPVTKEIEIKTPNTVGIEAGDKYVEFLKLIRNVSFLIIGLFAVDMGLKILTEIKNIERKVKTNDVN